ncbi:hypothetical protein C8R48DRAFT_674084 [Suillus tomentosus]|nr:hypothetical protein C8R48DRAFT_674084 [Suillus tomentosus]
MQKNVHCLPVPGARQALIRSSLDSSKGFLNPRLALDCFAWSWSVGTLAPSAPHALSKILSMCPNQWLTEVVVTDSISDVRMHFGYGSQRHLFPSATNPAYDGESASKPIVMVLVVVARLDRVPAGAVTMCTRGLANTALRKTILGADWKAICLRT